MAEAGDKGEADGHVQPEEVALNMRAQEAEENAEENLYLYEEDMKQMPRVATFLKSVMSYHTTFPSEKEAKEAKRQPKKAKLGVLLGVYLPTIQHIFGVLMFVRLAWIVGCSGTLESFFMVFICCITTFVTAISMSAIATNGVVQAGGSYFMISRNLGPECGGAVGMCFYLANTFAVDLYLLGTVEIFLQYMAPELAFFGDIHSNPWNNYRVYGTVAVLLETLVVVVGVKFVQLFAPFSLACVIVSIVAIYAGSFAAGPTTHTGDVWLCMVGDRLMAQPGAEYNGSIADWCTRNVTGALWGRYCDANDTCDPFFESSDITIQAGIPGMASGIIKDNLWPNHLHVGEVTPGVQGDHHRGEIISDISTSFVHLCAIYFPSVTGIMTGSNMSGDLKDPQQSIPIGTILAQLTCSFVYLSFVLLFGATSHSALLRDKFGQSLGGSLLAAKLAWPSHWVVLVGAFCSTLGAALQCLTSAPRLLHAIARDGIIPFLGVFEKTNAKGEPIRAILITALIAECGILIASLDYIAPVIDVFFLMCYGFVNLTCVLQTWLQTPNWRPRFKYYHWSLSLLGVILNLALSIIAGWYYALSALLIAGFIYKYVEYKGGEREWGDGIRGLSMSAAQQSLLKVEEGDPHTKNWRPQLLVLCKLQADLEPKYKTMFNIASQLKAGKGLTIVAGVLDGEYCEMGEKAAECRGILKKIMAVEKVKGFAKVMVTKNITEGLNIFVQTTGLGGLKPNTVMVGWPAEWNASHEDRHWKVFLDTVRTISAKDMSLLVPRGIENFPNNKERMSGTMDVWWIVHDGGMLILLSFLFKQHKVWKNCKLRIFTVAQLQDNSIQLKKDLEMFLYQLRIEAEVHVEEMYDNDISAYTVERTLDMEKRNKMLKEMHLQRRGTIQEIVDASHTPGSGSNSPKDSEGKQESERRSHSKEPEEVAAVSSMATLRLPGDEGEDGASDKQVQFTFSASDGAEASQADKTKAGLKRAEGRLMRMHTAVKLNTAIRDKSGEADMVILNFPAPPAKLSAEENYMEYLDALTEGINRVLMVRGSGKEVITIYS